MRKEDFNFNLPSHLIAQTPLAKRTDSRLLVFNKQQSEITDSSFKTIIEYFDAGDLIIFNNTQVIPARLHGNKVSGGKVEMLIERIIDDKHCICHIRANKSPSAGCVLLFDTGVEFIVTGRTDKGLFECELVQGNSIDAVLDAIGHMPLPPYIERDDDELDLQRYQTVYAKHKGSVAAPTAGLHFDKALLQALEQKGVLIDYVTLHVGAGTFQPVRESDLSKHQMHSETIEVPAHVCEQIEKVKAMGNKVIAVGTTAVRSLESAARNGQIKPYQGETDIFICPGYEFKVCDVVLTNFHLPESSLIMLVAAFIGYEQTMTVYHHAIAQQYRFFSYGDACLFI